MRTIYLFRFTFSVVLSLLMVSAISAATITVTSSADNGPGSLRQAVDNAAAGDLIVFSQSTDGMTILLSSMITLSTDVSIQGRSGKGTTISGGDATRIFNITGGATVLLQRLILTNGLAAESGGAVQNIDGDVTLDDVTIMNSAAMGPASNMGGGAVHNAGTMLIKNSFFTGNTATMGSGSGGGVLNSLGGDLTITDTQISGNEANRAGGGIEEASGMEGGFIMRGGSLSNNIVNTSPGNGGGIHVGGGGTTSIAFVTIDGNTAGAEGGGVWNAGVMSLDRNMISNNFSFGTDADQGGGGAYNESGTLTIKRTVISGNSAIAANGGVPGSGSGGGILNNDDATLVLVDVDITGNEANRAGGGIEVRSGSVSIRGGSVSNNIVNVSPGNGGGIHTGGGTLNVASTTFDGNTAGQEGGGIWSAGTTTIENSDITNNTSMGTDADDGGGGVFVQAGSTSISGGSIMGNTATASFADGNASEDGGPTEGDGSGSGGGILIRENTSLFLNNVAITNNEANRAGGGIEVRGGDVIIRNGSVSNNVVNASPGNGGGIHTGGGTLNIAFTSFDGNMAGQEGGGIWSAGETKIARSTITNNVAMGTDADDGGGGVFVQAGETTISGGSIMGNTATASFEEGNATMPGGPTTGDGSGSGGGILNRDGASLTVNGVQIMNNEANRAGGGIEVRGGTVIIRGGSISDNTVNTSPGNGGGIHTGGGNTNIAFTEFSGNTAGQEGGGLWNGGTMDVERVTVINNIALGEDADDGGGGFFNQAGTLTIVRSRIANNTAIMGSGSGGGILNNMGAQLIVRSTNITGNEANRAGGGFEDRSGPTTVPTFTNTNFRNNTVNTSPGNGGAIHISGDDNMDSGDMIINGGTVSGNSAGREGGGFWNGDAQMTVIGVTFTDNVALGTEANRGGGALFNNGGDLVVTGSTFTNNTALMGSGSGGAILVNGGSVSADNSTFTNNQSARAGGAVELASGSYSSIDSDYIDNVTGMAGNGPGNGGALHVTTATTVDMTGGDITGNMAMNEGGGVWNNAGTIMTLTEVNFMNNDGGTVGGGAVFVNNGTVDIVRSLLANNTTSGVGGGIHNANAGEVTVMASTITGNESAGVANNSSGDVTLSGVTIAMNDAGLLTAAGTTGTISVTGSIIGLNDTDVMTGTTVTSGGFNLIGDDTDGNFTEMGSDIEGGTLGLEPLADNGGPTMTHAIDCTSDAVDLWVGATQLDQRGEMPFGDRDAGAFELQSICIVIPIVENDAPTSFNDAFATESLSTYPNPVSASEMTVKMPVEFSGQVTLRLVDQNGRVQSQRVINSDVTNYQFPVNDLPMGTYILQAISGSESQSTRVMIVR